MIWDYIIMNDNINPKLNTTSKVFSINLADIKLPEFNPTQVKRQPFEWFKYGSDNLFPQLLIDAVRKNTEHAAFVGLKESLIAGDGFATKNTQAEALLKSWSDEGTADDFLVDIATDLSVLETFAAQVVYDKGKKKIANVFYIDSSTIRPSKTLDNRNNSVGYYLSGDWKNYKMSGNEPVFYPRFDTNKPEEKTQIYFYRKRALGQPYLPEVSYLSALNWIELGKELSKFGLNYVLNGFFPSGLLNVKGISEMDKEAFERDVKNTFQSSENAGKIIITASETDGALTFTPFSTTDNTPMLNALNDLVVSKVASAHRGNPILAGIQSAGNGLVDSGETYSTNLQIFENSVVRQSKKEVLKFVNKVLKFNGVSDSDLDIKNLSVLPKDVDDSILADFFTPEILADKYGIDPKYLLKNQNNSNANEQDSGI